MPIVAIAATVTPSPFATPKAPPTATSTATPLAAPSNTPTPTPSAASTGTVPPTQTFTATPAPTASATPTRTPTATLTPRPILAQPQNLAIYNKTGNLWVANRGNNTISEVDGAYVTRILTMLPNVPDPNGVGIWQAGGMAYVTNKNQGSLTEIDVNNKRVLRTISLPSKSDLPWGVAVDETTGDVYVAAYGTNRVFCYNHSSGQVRAAATLPQPAKVFYSVSGRGIYVTARNGTVNQVYCSDSSHVVETTGDTGLFDLGESFDGTTGFMTSTTTKRVYTGLGALVELPNAPYGLAVLGNCLGAVVPAEDKLYIIDWTIDIISYTTPVGKQTLPEGGQGIAYNRANDTVYITNYGANSVTAIRKPCPVFKN